MTRNKFTPTDNDKLNSSIDLVIDHFKNADTKEKSEHFEGEIQGIRTVLACFDRDKYQRTIHDLAEILIKFDKFPSEY